MQPRVFAIGLVGLTVGAVTGALLMGWLTTTEPVAQPLARTLGISVPADRTIVDFTIAPDGTKLVYSAVAEGRVQLFLRRLDRYSDQPIPGTAGATQPFFAPDSERVAYFADGALRKVHLDGSDAVEICPVSSATAGGSWGPDDRIVFAPLGGRGLQTVPAVGGPPQPLTQVDDLQGEVAHGWPHVLPDGESLIFTVGRTGRGPRLMLFSLVSEERRDLVPIDGGASYVSTGHVVYAWRGDVFALPIDTAALSAVGAPRVVAGAATSSVAAYDRLGSSSVVAARDGTLVYRPTTDAAEDNRLVLVDRRGRVTSVDTVAAPHQTPRMSPDGAQIIMAVRSDFFTRDLWLYDIGTLQRRQLTRDSGDNHSPLWSRDGRRVAFASNRDGPQRIYRLNVAGENRAETVVFGDARTPGSWAPDGRALFFHETHPIRARDIWLWSTDNAESTRLIATDANERGPAISPNGRWLAYVSDDQTGDQVYVRRHPSEDDPHRVSPAGGTEPVWSRDGSELFYRRGLELHVVAVDGQAGTTSEPSRLFDGVFAADPGGHLPAYDINRDGSALVSNDPEYRMVEVCHREGPIETEVALDRLCRCQKPLSLPTVSLVAVEPPPWWPSHVAASDGPPGTSSRSHRA